MKITLKQIIKDYIELSRYVALGSLDGILTVLSISLTAAVVGITGGTTVNPLTVGLTGLSGGIAIALSNGFGSYVGEQAEEGKVIRELESKMLLEERTLDDTLIHQQAKYRVFMSMLTHGSASFMGSFIPSIPFFIFSDIYTALTATLIVCFSMMIILGCYLGRISKESMTKTTLKIISVGVLIVIISYLMGGGHGA
ncbi:MAG: TIGR00267 family protein [Methanosphaera sp.]|nr:TIGR00267 family protein [Methanosphaera sp.]MBR3213005.1 TIGR00267 family protein [Methanosphaera sp.]